MPLFQAAQGDDLLLVTIPGEGDASMADLFRLRPTTADVALVRSWSHTGIMNEGRS